MISLENGTSLRVLEDFQSKLCDADAAVLRVPTNLSLGGAFGVPAGIIQLIGAWARTQPNPTLQFHAGLANADYFQSLANTPHGMVAIYFAQSIRNPSDGSIISARPYRSYLIPPVMAMQQNQFQKTMGGRGVFLCCFAGARNEYIRPFYPREDGEKIRSRSDFRLLTDNALEAFAPEALRRFIPNDLDNLSLLIYELFSNTHDHARVDVNGSVISRSVRGILLKHIPKGYGARERDFNASDVALNRYLTRALARDETPRTVTKSHQLSKAFLEITVFDTGPGLVRRWLSAQSQATNLASIKVEEEFEVVRSCFSEHVTTKSILGSGQGLPTVLETLKKLRAFLRLRTGRLCLVQDFSEPTSVDFSLKHWLAAKPLLPDTLGAVYSIVVPLSSSQS